MRHKITLLTAAVVLAFLAGVTSRAFAQTFEATHASTLILAGNGTDPVHTLTITVASLSGASTLTLPGGNAAGLLTNPGNGMLTWTPLSLSSLPTEAANTLLGNPTGSTAATTTITLGTGLAFNTGALTISGTLPTGLILNGETIGGTTTINTSGSITGGAGSFTTLSASGNTTLDASPSTGGTVNIGNATSTTTITGTVTYTTTPSIPLATNNIFTGQGGVATALPPTANSILITGGSSPFQTPQWATTLPTGLTLNNETIGGTTTINTSGSITGGAGSFTTLSASGNTSLDASPSTGGTVNIGNATSTTTITGTVTYTTTPSIPLATNNIFTGQGGVATALPPTANSILITGGSSPFQTPQWATTLPTGLTLNNETIGGTTTINTSGSITGGAGSFTTLNSSGNTSLDASPSTGGTVNIGNSTSTTNIAGAVTFTGSVTLPAGSVSASSIGLANQNIFVGNSSGDASAVAPTANSVLITDATAPIGTPHWATTLPTGLILGGETINGASTINITGAIATTSTLGVTGLTTATGGISVPSTAGINNSSTINTVVASTTNIDATTGAEGVINIGNNGGTTPLDSSTTNIAGALNISGTTSFTGPVTFTTAPTIPLTTNDLFVGVSGNATPLATANGGVLNTSSSGVPSITATPTLGVAGTTAGTLTLASGAAAFTTQLATSATTPTASYVYQFPAQTPTSPTNGQVLTAGTPTGTGPYTIPLSWATPASVSSGNVNYNVSSAQTGASSSNELFNVSYGSVSGNPTLAGALISSVLSTGNGNATGLTITASAHSTGSSATGLEIFTSGGSNDTAIAVRSGNVNIAGLTTNEPVFTDANDNLASVATVPIANGGTNSSTALTNGKVMISSSGAIVEGPAWNSGTSTLTGNITGNAGGSAASFTGSLAGDVSGPQGTTVIGAGKVTYAKIQNETHTTLLGNPTAATSQAPSEITLGAGLSFTGSVLNTTNSGSVTSVGMTVPSFLSVSPATITSSGTFGVTWLLKPRTRSSLAQRLALPQPLHSAHLFQQIILLIRSTMAAFRTRLIPLYSVIRRPLHLRPRAKSRLALDSALLVRC